MTHLVERLPGVPTGLADVLRRRPPGVAPVATLALCGLLAACAPAGAATEPRPSAAQPVNIVTPAQSSARPSSAAAVAGSSRSWLSIPSIGVHGLRVVSYPGYPDDPPGTRIEDRGLAASPQGPLGGVLPGQVGNLIVTAHRTSAGGPLRRLPSLHVGAHILVRSGGSVFDYVVTGTMKVSFRSRASMARQSAAVPGRPGLTATRAMITVSTCATPEDHARRNFWADALGNPEHRIDKVGVLVAVR